tara:strand:+ start:290 stop:520 length:231 start_codon:yes stop_codon:yes gene_type:complete
MKFNNQIFVVAALFILLVVLCFSWVSRELFSGHESTTSVFPVNSLNNSKYDPYGYNGLTYYQDFETHYNSTHLPRQ